MLKNIFLSLSLLGSMTFLGGMEAKADCSDFQAYNPSPPDTGIYWFKESLGTSVDKVRSSANPGIDYYDPSKKTLIFVHGKQNPDKVANGFYERFDYKNHDCENGKDFDEDIVKIWRGKGWNVGAFYWSEFASLSYPDAERAIWNSDVINGDKSVSDMFVDEYKFVMQSGYGNQEIRLVGHSFGSQVVLAAGAKIMTSSDLAPNEKPDRFALVDPALSNRHVIGAKAAAVVGNEAASSILSHGNIALEYYRVSEANFGIQATTGLSVFDNSEIQKLRRKSAFAELEPWYIEGISPFNGGSKHIAASYLYMDSMRNERTPEVTLGDWVCRWIFCTWDATIRKDTGNHALSAATPTDKVRHYTGARYYWEQVDGRRSGLTNDDKFKRRNRW